ncbi:MAG: exodeoxyribonuclease VII large subunit [Candidatus Saccharimonadales bacterium]
MMINRQGLRVAIETTGLELSVSEFVALLNQTLEYAYPDLVVSGELANFRVSKDKWVYFDLKDELSTVKFFGTVFQLPGPLEDGMLLKVRGQPRLHNRYGFSVNVQWIRPAGEGSIRRAADLLKAKLAKEGLFDEERKRPVPYPPRRIGLITSRQSAAYADFVKVLGARWGGLEIELIDTQVQGENAARQLTEAMEQFNALARPPEVIVMIRGGGSAEDLAAFSSEQVTRAVAASRVPTLVAIGHEIDLSLAELAADKRASTPSNAAELLVPDRQHTLRELRATAEQLRQQVERRLQTARDDASQQAAALGQYVEQIFFVLKTAVQSQARLLAALNPEAVLRRGYAIVRLEGQAVRSTQSMSSGGIVDIQLADGHFAATVDKVKGTHGKR